MTTSTPHHAVDRWHTFARPPLPVLPPNLLSASSLLFLPNDQHYLVTARGNESLDMRCEDWTWALDHLPWSPKPLLEPLGPGPGDGLPWHPPEPEHDELFTTDWGAVFPACIYSNPPAHPPTDDVLVSTIRVKGQLNIAPWNVPVEPVTNATKSTDTFADITLESVHQAMAKALATTKRRQTNAILGTVEPDLAGFASIRVQQVDWLEPNVMLEPEHPGNPAGSYLCGSAVYQMLRDLLSDPDDVELDDGSD